MIFYIAYLNVEIYDQKCLFLINQVLEIFDDSLSRGIHQ